MVEEETVLGEVLGRWKFMICDIVIEKGRGP